MLRIGLTGGIGSGKSVVAQIFEILGVPVYYADIEAKKIMNEDVKLRQQIIEHFGREAYINNLLNREFMAGIVFKDKEKLELLNSLIHPITIQKASDWMKKQNTAYVIKEAALIFESGSQSELDYVIGVQAPLHLRIQRAMKRDQASREEVLQRMNYQIEESIKIKLCNFIIINDERHLLIRQVLDIHKKLQELSKSYL